MSDPTKILEREAKQRYSAWRKEQRARRIASPFALNLEPWSELPNDQREVWRMRALAALRSEETVADELKREDRERRVAGGHHE